jgi:hypothetical protein
MIHGLVKIGNHISAAVNDSKFIELGGRQSNLIFAAMAEKVASVSECSFHR